MSTRETDRPTYVIHRARLRPELQGLWDGPAWRDIEPLHINHFHPRGSDHRPTTHAKAIYDDQGLYVIFDVMDRYVRCIHTEFQSMVCQDSCVEFFVQPAGMKGYLNFEFNCGGTMLVYHVIDPTRTKEGLKQAEPLSADDTAGIKIWHSLPTRIEPEIDKGIPWRLEIMFPWTSLTRFGAQTRPIAGQTWRGNLYKCGDETSHPHWGAWADISPDLNFHQPQLFGILQFKD